MKRRVRIRNPQQEPLDGRNLSIEIYDEGVWHLLPANSVVIKCDGRRGTVEATVVFKDVELDVTALTEAEPQ